MASFEVSRDFIVPESEGRSFRIRAGQILRLVEEEGPQAIDLMIHNDQDHRETYSAWFTRQSSRSFTKAPYLYSRLPAGRKMFTLLSYGPGLLWVTAGRCNAFLYRNQYGLKEYHKNCHDILAAALKEHGISEWDMGEVFNVFMNATFTSDGSYSFSASPVKAGDHVDMRAEMDCLVAISACPDDIGAYNEKKPKPVRVKILEAATS